VLDPAGDTAIGAGDRASRIQWLRCCHPAARSTST
jgi:hypothetical protein